MVNVIFVGPTKSLRTACVGCGVEFFSCTGFDDNADDIARGARPGDITICAECGHIQAFDDALVLRELTDDEAVAVAGNPVLVELQKMRKLRKR